MAMQKIKPAAADWALSVIDAIENHPNLVHAYLPETAPAQRRWLEAINIADKFGEPFVEWAARNASEMGQTLLEVRSVIKDISDWVASCYRARAIRRGRVFAVMLP